MGGVEGSELRQRLVVAGRVPNDGEDFLRRVYNLKRDTDEQQVVIRRMHVTGNVDLIGVSRTDVDGCDRNLGHHNPR